MDRTADPHCRRFEPIATRRQFFQRAGAGLGMLALADLLGDRESRAGDGTVDPLAPKPAHIPARAKAVIWLMMEGGPSAVDLFDPKPELDRQAGKRIDIDVFNGN